jgi:ribosomal protection tetracycline resistance protein
VQVGEGERKVIAISVFDRGSAVQRDSVVAREIGKMWGLGEITLGDAIGVAPSQREHHFAPPTLETAIVPCDPGEKGALHVALTQLAEQDPLINLRQDDLRQELFLSLYGEVQKEVIQETLATDYGVDVDFRGTTTICAERLIGTGTAVEELGRPNPFLATVGLRLEPAPVDTGVEFRLEVELGSMPLAFFRAVEETVRKTLQQGLRGWQVLDCAVTMTHSGYSPPSSTAGDFRHLTPLVLMSALEEAGTVVCEPINRFRIDAPMDTVGHVLSALARLEAVPQAPDIRGSSCVIEGDIAAARVHELRLELPALTRGEGVLESEFGRYEPVTGDIPSRPRSDWNPLNREEYMLRAARGGSGVRF